VIVIGELRDRVAFQAAAGEGWTETTSNVAAAVTALSATERAHYGDGVTHKIYTLWRGDIADGMRAARGGEIYAIISAADRDGTGICLEILAQLVEA
jgi:head-tail adaptor